MKRAILLVDHGSRQAEANELLERIAAELRLHTPGCSVHVAHMELAEPTVAQGLDAAASGGAGEIVVFPYFLGPGRHTTRDIPRLVEEAARRHPGVEVRLSEPLGFHPKLVDVILERVAAASP